MFGFRKKEAQKVNQEAEEHKLELDSENLAVPEVHVQGVTVDDNNDKQAGEIDYDGAVPEFHVMKKS